MSKQLEHSDSDVSLASTVHIFDVPPIHRTVSSLANPNTNCRSVLLQPNREPIHLDYDIYEDATAPGKLFDKNHCAVSYSKEKQHVVIQDHIVSSFNPYTKHKLSNHHRPIQQPSYQYSNPYNITYHHTQNHIEHDYMNGYDTQCDDHPYIFNDPNDYNHNTSIENDAEANHGTFPYFDYF